MDAFKKKAIALSALSLALLFGAAFQGSNSVLDQLKAIRSEISGLESEISNLEAQVASLPNKGPRKFYLTQTSHIGDQVLTACAAGYHMASLWEIHDPSNLRYDTQLGTTKADSGFGPPNFFGWIRTGNIPGGVGFGLETGQANCGAWTSPGINGPRGTIASLGWSTSFLDLPSPWVAVTAGCEFPFRVWCVQD
jgi:hypothetical protein